MDQGNGDNSQSITDAALKIDRTRFLEIAVIDKKRIIDNVKGNFVISPDKSFPAL